MLRYATSFVLLLSVITLAPLAKADGAQPVPHKEHCLATITTFTADTIEYAGSGNATHLGRYTIVGGHHYDADGNLFDGDFVSTAADGSTLFGVYTGTTTILPDGTGRSDLHVQWIGGTGRLAGVSGEGDVVCFHGLIVGAALEYFTDAVITRP
jgi:hypothetical protein